jgi:hypothetical protein
MMLRTELRKLVRARLKDAEVLCANRRYAGAVYLCGYAVELALQERICKTLGWQAFQRQDRRCKAIGALWYMTLMCYSISRVLNNGLKRNTWRIGVSLPSGIRNSAINRFVKRQGNTLLICYAQYKR